MSNRREPTEYPGVFYYEVQLPGGKRGKARKKEKCFFVIFRRPHSRKQFEEVVGTTSEGWTAAKASNERAALITGKLTKKEEQEKEARQAAEAAATDAAAVSAKFTVDDAWERYSEHKNASHQDKSRYKLYVKPHCGAKAVSELTPMTMTALRKKVEDQGRSPQTVKHVLALIRRVLNWCDEMDLCTVPAKIKYDIPQFENEKEEHLTEEELAKLLTALKKKQDAYPVGCGLIQLAVFTGLRPIQMTHLKWTDIDLINDRITVRKKSQKKNATNTIPINEMAKEVLQRLKHINEWVFPSQRGGPLVHYRKAVMKVLDGLELPEGFRPLYGLRHNFASWVANLPNADLHQLKELMTHDDLRTTMRYAHLFDKSKRKATDQLGRKFKSFVKKLEKEKKEGSGL